MTTWRGFLVEHAKFPFPHPVEDGYVGTADLSQFDVGLLNGPWRAQRAVRDETLVQKLCETLDNILQDTPLPANSEDQLLYMFGHHLQFPFDVEDPGWSRNGNGSQVRIPDSHSRLSNSG